MKSFLAIVLGLAVGLGSTAYAEPLNIDFGSVYTGLPTTYGAQASQVGSWNDIISLGTTSDLLDVSGFTTDVSVTVSADNSNGDAVPPSINNDRRLLSDNFFSNSSSSWSVEFAGLDAGIYDVYYYAPDNTAVETGAFTVNGTPATHIVGFPGAGFLLFGNYAVVSGVSISESGSLSLVSSTTTAGFSGLSGLQLVPIIPEPSSSALLSIGTISLLGYCRRRWREAS